MPDDTFIDFFPGGISGATVRKNIYPLRRSDFFELAAANIVRGDFSGLVAADIADTGSVYRTSSCNECFIYTSGGGIFGLSRAENDFFIDERKKWTEFCSFCSEKYGCLAEAAAEGTVSSYNKHINNEMLKDPLYREALYRNSIRHLFSSLSDLKTKSYPGIEAKIQLFIYSQQVTVKKAADDIVMYSKGHPLEKYIRRAASPFRTGKRNALTRGVDYMEI